MRMIKINFLFSPSVRQVSYIEYQSDRLQPSFISCPSYYSILLRADLSVGFLSTPALLRVRILRDLAIHYSQPIIFRILPLVKKSQKPLIFDQYSNAQRTLFVLPLQRPTSSIYTTVTKFFIPS
jgi:hypothetical protein